MGKAMVRVVSSKVPNTIISVVKYNVPTVQYVKVTYPWIETP